MPQALKIPDAKSRGGSRIGEARKVASLASDPCKDQKRGHPGSSKKDQITVHFATLVDICHLKNTELEPKFQKLQRPSCAAR